MALSHALLASLRAKLVAWFSGLVLLVALGELAAELTGLPVSLARDNLGKVTLLLVAMTGLLAIVASERRPMAAYGLVIDRYWLRRGFRGFAVGVVFYVAYLTLACAAGTCELTLNDVSLSRCGKALLAMPSSLPVAAAQQVIFAGLLLGLVRVAAGRWLAVVCPALLFGLTMALGNDAGATSPAGMRLGVGMALLAALLGTLRLTSGSIVLPAGVLAGALAVRRVTSKLHLLVFDTSHPWAALIAPEADTRQAVLFWALLAVATLVSVAYLVRHGEGALTTDTQRDAQFKRFMPFSNLMTFISLDRWLVLLTQARWRVGLIYSPRLIVTLLGSTIGTVLALPERLLAPLLLRHMVPDPVFVVGMPRSGTTHLHNMLSLDPQFRAPRNYEVFNPLGFLTGWFTTALMTPALMWRRPMDSVQMTPFSSQEEEFALAAMGSPSPYLAFCLPGQSRRHLRFLHVESFSPRQQRRWERDYRLFLRKITLWTRRTPLLKNPANTGRLNMLRQLFPGAKFVCLVRHPEDVYRSNLHFARNGLVVFQLQDQPEGDGYVGQLLGNYRRVSLALEADLQRMPADQAIRVRFEDIESQPEATIARIYEQLGLTMSLAYRQKLRDYVAAQADYTKNQFRQLPAEEADEVRRVMGEFYAAWGYGRPEDERKVA